MRRSGAILAFLVGIILSGCDQFQRSPAPASTPTGWQVNFSPRGGCTEAIVAELNRATNSVRVLAYSFTSKPIAAALVAAHRRGASVAVVLDSDQRTAQYSEADFLAHAGIRTLFDGKHAIQHNKVIVIDGATVITGSFNFTKAAEERNAENLLVIHDPNLARQYLDNWQEHEAHSKPYAGR
jgi:phosphatidylserine/phosphatidylglycerophosphate/cardiolipin synthase-like enzyme